MRLHSLHSMHEHSFACHILRSLLSDQGSFNATSWPEGMPHLSTRLLDVLAKIGGSILAYHERWCLLCDSEIDGTRRVDCRLDCVCLAIFAERKGAFGRGEVALVVHELEVGEHV